MKYEYLKLKNIKEQNIIIYLYHYTVYTLFKLVAKATFLICL